MSCFGRKVTMSYWAVRTLRRIARDLRSFEDGRIPNDAVDGFVLNLQIAYRELLVIIIIIIILMTKKPGRLLVSN